jgi:hypothetical protein
MIGSWPIGALGSPTVASVNDRTRVGTSTTWAVLCGNSGAEAGATSSVDAVSSCTALTTPLTRPISSGSGRTTRTGKVRQTDDTSAVTSTVPWSR